MYADDQADTSALINLSDEEEEECADVQATDDGNISYHPSSYFKLGTKRRFYYRIEQPVISVNLLPKNGISNSTKWTEELNQRLLSAVAVYQDTGQDVDWEEVARTCSPRQPVECLIQFRNVLDPSINRGDWTKEEERLLLSLAVEHGEREWWLIAEKLGTGRTPVQCLRHYQQHLNTDNHAVSAEMERKSQSAEKYENRRARVEDLAKGVWLEHEERILMLAAIAYGIPTAADHTKALIAAREESTVGSVCSSSSSSRSGNGGGDQKRARRTQNKDKSWAHIARLIPNKNELQCREKFVVRLDPTVDDSWGNYSPEEDAQLTSLVERYGEHCWTKITENMPHRTDSSVRNRWIKKLKKN